MTLYRLIGNACRSPMAEFVLKDMVSKMNISNQFHIASVATSTEEIGNSVHYGTRKKLNEQGISCDGKYAVQLKKADYENYDYLIGMDAPNIRNIERITGHQGEKIHMLLEFAGLSAGIADPWYSMDFDKTYRDVKAGCQALLEYLKERGELR